MIKCLVMMAVCLPLSAAAVPPREAVRELIRGGETWLLAQQNESGAFLGGDHFVLGITGLATMALAKAPVRAGIDVELARAAACIRRFRQDDGGFYDPVEGLPVYGTSLALLALSELRVLAPEEAWAGREFLGSLQNTIDGDRCRGGIGVMPDNPARAEDLHNTSHALAALRATGVSHDDPRMIALLSFLERCQNRSLPKGQDDRAWVTGDGGGVYSPSEKLAAGDWRVEDPDFDSPPVLASYGSMTYALLSSYLMLDLAPDDPRVRSALSWVTNHYTVNYNPGMPEPQRLQGLFYHRAVMAKTFSLLRQTTATLPDGSVVDWRVDLFTALQDSAIVTDAGILWINSDQRWAEGMPHLCTAYAIDILKRIDASL